MPRSPLRTYTTGPAQNICYGPRSEHMPRAALRTYTTGPAQNMCHGPRSEHVPRAPLRTYATGGAQNIYHRPRSEHVPRAPCNRNPCELVVFPATVMSTSTARSHLDCVQYCPVLHRFSTISFAGYTLHEQACWQADDSRDGDGGG